MKTILIILGIIIAVLIGFRIYLPSSILLSSTAMNSGSIESNSKINYMKDIPDFNIEMEIENVDMTKFNDFTMAYGGFEDLTDK